MTELNTILVVEDDPLVSEIISAALDDDYTTVVVETSALALAAIKQGGIRLMLLDCTLPGGVDPTLLPNADTAGIPVVLMSGDPARMDALSNHPRPFILKPFALTGLIEIVETTLGAE